MKWVFRIFLTFLLVVFIITGCVYYVINYKKQVLISLVVSKINNKLATKVAVADIDIFVFKNFPEVAVSFSKISIEEKNIASKKGQLLTLKELNFGINIWDVLNKNYQIKSINAKGGFVNLKIYKDGTDNFHFWKTDSTSIKDTSFFNLDNVLLNDINFKYVDEENNISANIYSNIIKLNGTFNKKTVINFVQDGTLNYFESNGFSLPKNKYLAINTNIIIDDKVIIINNSELNYAKFKLILNGNFNIENATYKFEVANKSKSTIKEILYLLPQKYAGKINSYNTNGDVLIQASLVKNQKQELAIKANIKTSNASLVEPTSNTTLSKINFNALFDNTFNNGYLDIKDFTAIMGNGNMDGRITVSNFKNPILIVDVKSSLNLSSVKKIAKIDTLEILEGNLNTYIKYEGPAIIKKYDDYKKIVTLKGFLDITKLKFKFLNDNRLAKSDSCKLQFNKTDIIFNKLFLNIGKTDLFMNGEVNNILPFLLGDDNNLVINANIQSNYFDLNDLLDNSKSNVNSTYNIAIPEGLTCVFNGKIKQFLFNKFNAQDLVGSINIKDKKILTKNISASTMGGKMQIKGTVSNVFKNVLNVSLLTELEKININKLFYELNNFSQDYLIDKNVAGTLTSSISFNGNWSNQLIADYKSIQCVADVNLVNGQLINFAPMLTLSKFVEIDDLKNVRFNDLKNTFIVKNEKIIIPQMDIHSNTINITMNGTHTFDNKIDYHLKLLLNDILAKKAKNKKENTEFGALEDDGTGRLNLFLSIKGTTSSPKITYDRIGFKQQLKNNLNIEKEVLKNLLKNEFSKNNSSSNNIYISNKTIGVDWNNLPEEIKKVDNSKNIKLDGKEKEKPKWLKKDKGKEDQNTDDFN